MTCTNKKCAYEWKPRTKHPLSCPVCKQYIKYKTDTKNCLQCGVAMKKPPKDTWEYWSVRKFCSLNCKGQAEVGIPKENRGEKNGMWKGYDVSYGALHDYVKSHLPKPILCNECSLEKPLDLANISQTYKRDLEDWEWLCRKCHMIKDGRLEKATKVVVANRKQYLKSPLNKEIK